MLEGLRTLRQKPLRVYFGALVWLVICIIGLILHPSPERDTDVFYVPVFTLNLIIASIFIVSLIMIYAVFRYAISSGRFGRTMWLMLLVLISISIGLDRLGGPLLSGPMHQDTYREGAQVFHVARTPISYDGGQTITYRCDFVGILCDVIAREADSETS